MSIHDQSAFSRIDDVVLAGAVFSQRPRRIGTGLVAGTRIETARGWTPVEQVLTGEKVQTFDGGLRPVTRIERTVYGADLAQAYPDGLLMVPGGALHNCDAFYLMPEQHVLLESAVAEEVLGRPAVLVPASALEGYRGIARVMPVDLVEVVTLFFDDEEVVYANTGALVHCAPRKAAGAALRRPATSAFFEVLPFDRARALVDLMEAGTPWAGQGDLAQAA
ncbi:Hint domain-containing protein [Palleronia sp. KMU-117]|uniref:Hint domain-containing protein n=1 Tax=Palleronia sp. KMU-117 TaxID=3434108 RepID=UPI003D746332